MQVAATDVVKWLGQPVTERHSHISFVHQILPPVCSVHRAAGRRQEKTFLPRHGRDCARCHGGYVQLPAERTEILRWMTVHTWIRPHRQKSSSLLGILNAFDPTLKTEVEVLLRGLPDPAAGSHDGGAAPVRIFRIGRELQRVQREKMAEGLVRHAQKDTLRLPPIPTTMTEPPLHARDQKFVDRGADGLQAPCDLCARRVPCSGSAQLPRIVRQVVLGRSDRQSCAGVVMLCEELQHKHQKKRGWLCRHDHQSELEKKRRRVIRKCGEKTT
mmetsp:Transcript_21294/g.60521  ORF Transcript_21294/g.60521 Transcript_21294/m.60521 type:complete len:272 (-) Transcript_21294:21-836(-)